MTTHSNPEASHHYGSAPRSRIRGAIHRAWIWLLLVLALAVAGALLYRFLPSSESTQPQTVGRRQGFDASRPMPVVAAAAKKGDVSVYLNGLGTVTPLATVTVRTRVDGQLMRVLFTEGQVVRAGELLAEIDPRTYEAQLEQAEGQLARDQALLANAQIDLERYRVLYKQDSVAEQQLATQDSLVRQYIGTVKMDQAAIDTAKLQLIYCRITAPVGGRIGLRLVDPGNIVHASDANGLIIITQLQPITVVFTIPEDNLRDVMAKLRAKDRLPVEAWDRADKTRLASGYLLTADNQIDTTTGTVKLKAQFANSDNALFPNQFVNTRMLVDVLRDATSISTAAVQRGRQGTYVYVVNSDDTVAVRPVTLGPVQGESVAIESGIAPGERVVVDGADKLREGAKIELGGGAAKRGPRGESGKGNGKGGGRKGGAQ